MRVYPDFLQYTLRFSWLKRPRRDMLMLSGRGVSYILQGPERRTRPMGGMPVTNLLIRWFERDYQNAAHPRVRGRYGQFASIVGIVTNVLLFALKLFVGLAFGSIAVVADALNNLTDSACTLVALVGFKMSGKPADAEHPYGHARMEYIAGLIVSFLVMFVGLQLLISSVRQIFSPRQAGLPGLPMLLALALSMLVKLWQCQFYRKIGGIIRSSTLLATAADSRNDILATGAVLLAALVTRLTGVDLDGWMGAAVALFILFSGARLVSQTISPLLGTAPTREMVTRIHQKILSYEGIIGLHDLHVHSYGAGQVFASVHCELPAEQDILLSHDLVDRIERDFAQQDNINLVIHLDPVVTADPKTNALKRQVERAVAAISPQISLHDFRVVWGVTHTNLIFDAAVPFDFHLTDGQLTMQITQCVQAIDPTYHVVLTVDHDPGMAGNST